MSREDEKDDEDTAHHKSSTLKNVRCISCKEQGHRIEQGVRDPNLKTLVPVAIENERIKKLKDCRKLHADTLVNTTHFIKKSVMIPL